MKAKHTPGPWEFDRTGKYYDKNVVRMNGVVVCQMAMVDSPGKSPGESEANARLIAAAPELLAACKRTVEVLGQIKIGDPLINDGHSAAKACRGAIAAAEGTDQ